MAHEDEKTDRHTSSPVEPSGDRGAHDVGHHIVEDLLESQLRRNPAPAWGTARGTGEILSRYRPCRCELPRPAWTPVSRADAGTRPARPSTPQPASPTASSAW